MTAVTDTFGKRASSWRHREDYQIRAKTNLRAGITDPNAVIATAHAPR